MPRRGSFINRNDSVDSTTACSLGNQSLGNAAILGGGSNFLGVPKSDSPGLLAVPTGHCGESKKFKLRCKKKVTWTFFKKKNKQNKTKTNKNFLYDMTGIVSVFCMIKTRMP